MNARRIAFLLVIGLVIQIILTAVAPSPAFANVVGSQSAAASLSTDGNRTFPLWQKCRDLESLPEYFHDYHFLPHLAPDPEWGSSENVC